MGRSSSSSSSQGSRSWVRSEGQRQSLEGIQEEEPPEQAGGSRELVAPGAFPCCDWRCPIPGYRRNPVGSSGALDISFQVKT